MMDFNEDSEVREYITFGEHEGYYDGTYLWLF